MRSLAADDERFKPLADTYWNARGGSHTDGGAFRFSVSPLQAYGESGARQLTCSNKFGHPVALNPDLLHAPKKSRLDATTREFQDAWINTITHAYDNGGPASAWGAIPPQLAAADWNDMAWSLNWLFEFGAKGSDEWHFARQTLTLIRDRRVNIGCKKRGSLLTLVDEALAKLFDHASEDSTVRVTWATRHDLKLPANPAVTLVLDALGFPAEGDDSAARYLVNASNQGWKRFIIYNWRGGRFAGVGLGANSQGVRADLYGDVGDYAGSGLDGAEVYIHGDGQDQLGQIMKGGKLVVHGDVGQTFLYGAKGGEIFVLGSAAGRPLINAAGGPRAVINGTCLDYLAESFMAGDPHKGGGFVILNGVGYTEDGKLVDLPSPYPGGNLFSLASGGAIFIRDPHGQVEEDQLNGGAFEDLTDADWNLIEPYLLENEKLFGIKLNDLLLVGGMHKAPNEVYRKVRVRTAETVLVETENR
jgi:glutamate synthase domain-containing protein 3